MASDSVQLQHAIMRGKYRGGQLPDYAKVNFQFLKPLPETSFRLSFGGFDDCKPEKLKGSDEVVAFASKVAAEEGRSFSIIKGLADFRAEAHVTITRAFQSRSSSGRLFVMEPLEVSFDNQKEKRIVVVSTSFETDFPARGIEVFLREGLGHSVTLKTRSPRDAGSLVFVEGVYSGVIQELGEIIATLSKEKVATPPPAVFDFNRVVLGLKEKCTEPKVSSVLGEMLRHSEILLSIARGDQPQGIITDASGTVLFRHEDVHRLVSLINSASSGRTIRPVDEAILNTAQEVARTRTP